MDNDVQVLAQNVSTLHLCPSVSHCSEITFDAAYRKLERKIKR